MEVDVEGFVDKHGLNRCYRGERAQEYAIPPHAVVDMRELAVIFSFTPLKARTHFSTLATLATDLCAKTAILGKVGD